MTWTYSDEYYKNYTRETWNESAPRYEPILRNLDVYNDDLLRHAEPAPGERVLDVATGPGEPALTLARRVGDEGEVVGIDLAERMVELARANAKTRGIRNAKFYAMDAENLEFEDERFDLVVCRFGLQIITDPDAAVQEIHRVLKPGGRLVACVWGPGERVPALHVVIGPMLDHAEPDENGYIPTPYEMGEGNELAETFRRAGFTIASEERVTRQMRFRDEQEFLEGMLHGTPVGHSLEEEDENVQDAVLRQARANLKEWITPEGVVLPGEALMMAGRK